MMKNKSVKAIKTFLYDLYQLFSYAYGNVKRYRQGEEKASVEKLLELIYWKLREGEFNTMYYAMGLNLKSSDSSGFIGRKGFLDIKNRV